MDSAENVVTMVEEERKRKIVILDCLIKGDIMGIKFNKKIVDLMHKTMDKTKRNELGFTLCLDSDNKLTKGYSGSGRYEDISFKKIAEAPCKKSEQFVGIFHTHPIEKATIKNRKVELSQEASLDDLYRSRSGGFMCVGTIGNPKNTIKCYTIKSKLDKKRLDNLNKRIEENDKKRNKVYELRKSNKITKEEANIRLIKLNKIHKKDVKKTVDESFNEFSL